MSNRGKNTLLHANNTIFKLPAFQDELNILKAAVKDAQTSAWQAEFNATQFEPSVQLPNSMLREQLENIDALIEREQQLINECDEELARVNEGVTETVWPSASKRAEKLARIRADFVEHKKMMVKIMAQPIILLYKMCFFSRTIWQSGFLATTPVNL